MSDKPTLAVPVVLCGKFPEVATRVAEILAPEYEVVHIITNVDAGLDELPKLLAGEAIRPSSGLGTNAKNASLSMTGRTPTPRAILVGRGYGEPEYAQLRGVQGASSVPWFKPGHAPAFDAATGRPDPADIGKRLKQAIVDSGILPGSEASPGNGVEFVY